MHNTFASKILSPSHFTIINLARQLLHYQSVKNIKQKGKVGGGGGVCHICLTTIRNEVESLFLIRRTNVQSSSKLHEEIIDGHYVQRNLTTMPPPPRPPPLSFYMSVSVCTSAFWTISFRQKQLLILAIIISACQHFRNET